MASNQIRPSSLARTRPRLVAGFVRGLSFVPWLVIFFWLSQLAWFICDDSFISFRYARNLIEEQGLVFNVGERVEGYTNFLWILELAGAWALLGARPETISLVLSSLCTLGCFALVLRDALDANQDRYRWLTAWMAVGFLASNASFAVWTSSGLETRQFTLLVLLGVLLSPRSATGPGRPMLASACFGAAALTRPEGIMFGLLALGFRGTTDWLSGHPRYMRLAREAAPFALLVGLHFAFRYAYYGELLPNTYYAKHVRPWYESGFRYLVAGGLETGLYALAPLAMLGARHRIRRARDTRHLLGLLLIGVHAYYLLRIGGDHFEYRPMDLYFPLLAVPAAEGTRMVAHWFATLWTTQAPSLKPHQKRLTEGLSYSVFAVTWVYASAIQGQILHLNSTTKGYAAAQGLQLDLTQDNTPLLSHLPGMEMLFAISNELRRACVKQSVAVRAAEHREFAASRIAAFKPYEHSLAATLIPKDATAAMPCVGVVPFYLPTMPVLDTLGLTDRTVARNPVVSPNGQRQMAHDRRPPPGYLQRRGAGFHVYPPEPDKAGALKRAPYAVPVADNLWMPFEAPDHAWVQLHFADKGLAQRQQLSNHSARSNWIHHHNREFQGRKLLSTFEHNNEGWTLEGAAVRHDGKRHYAGQLPVLGRVGKGFLTSYHPTSGDQATGRAQSPPFQLAPGEALGFLIAGGARGRLKVRLLMNGQQMRQWRGQSSEKFRLITWAPPAHTPLTTAEFRLELVDEEEGPWGHLMLDHLVIYEPARTTAAVQTDNPLRL